MLKSVVLDVEKFADGIADRGTYGSFADGAENEPFEVPKRVGGSGGALTTS